MSLTNDQVAQQCIDAINKKIKNLDRLNIIVVGKAGVGKSTLINSLFRGNFAEVGLGRPVTKNIRKIEKKDYPLTVYDTPGFELSDEQQGNVKKEVMDIINYGLDTKDSSKAIHCIWYCINVGGNRTFDKTEIEWLRELTDSSRVTRTPLIVVLTQSCPKKKAEEMKNLVEQENLNIVKVVPVLAQDIDFDGEYVARAFGLDYLIDVMSETLPSELQETLQNIQKVSLESKKKLAHAAVVTAVTASFGEGFAPIPFSDAALLIPTQVSMIGAITAIFGIDISKAFLTGFISSTLGTGGATILGKNIVSNLLKLIPGVGTVVGGVISGTTAGLLTMALGETYITIMEQIFKGEMKKEDLNKKTGQDRMKRIFRAELKKKKVLPPEEEEI